MSERLLLRALAAVVAVIGLTIGGAAGQAGAATRTPTHAPRVHAARVHAARVHTARVHTAASHRAQPDDWHW